MPTCRSDPIADCADLRIVPTLTRHAFRSGRFLLATSAQSCPGAPAQSCLSARFRARDCSLLRDPRRQYWSERAGPDEVSPSGSAVRFFAPQRAIPHFGSGRGRMRPLGFCRPRRRVTLLCRGVHEGRRHNPQVGTKPSIATAVMHERFLAEDVMCGKRLERQPRPSWGKAMSGCRVSSTKDKQDSASADAIEIIDKHGRALLYWSPPNMAGIRAGRRLGVPTLAVGDHVILER